MDATEALALNQGRVALRGNLDPSSLFFLGDEKQVHDQTLELCRQVHSSPWILSSGCDIPAGTPAKNLAAFVKAAHQSAG
ncbi:MAG: hypothetical protein H3C63_05940 [Candidatus Omnitrophica bacterium]|nr:hypothetical protein [Candidatus Omnitrophota bacterium]